jgi:hypothetical protein
VPSCRTRTAIPAPDHPPTGMTARCQPPAAGAPA